MITPDQKDLIKKLFQRNCTEEDFEQLFKIVPYLPKDEADRVLKALWEQKQDYPKLDAGLSEKMYGTILSRVDRQDQEDNPREDAKTVPLNPSGRRLLKVMSIAAGLLLLSSISIWLWMNQDQAITVTTAFAEQRTLTLPDGSEVKLNANSSLKYNKNWNQIEDRKVWLTGEAFFVVAKKPESGQKFKVITADLAVEVLGTVFNVNSRRAQTTVFLEEGKIALQLNQQLDQVQEMLPGDLLTYSAGKDTILAHTQKPNAQVHTSWKEGVLVFDETPLTEVLQRIEEIYGITFSVQDPGNKRRKITTTGLPMAEIETVIPMLEQTLKLEIRKEGAVFIVQ